jgi:hypothetical protein
MKRQRIGWRSIVEDRERKSVREIQKSASCETARAEARPSLARLKGEHAGRELKDVSSQFQFWSSERGDRVYRHARGDLGVPGQVQVHRSKAEQRQTSHRTGDDAGHLIGARFGAPGSSENLSRQNWIQNRGAGTFSQLENVWEAKLKAGVAIHAHVTDVYRKGENRPIGRLVSWTETAADGTRTEHRQDFVNPHSSRSREALARRSV